METRTYGTGDASFDQTYENALNGIDPKKLTPTEAAEHEDWVNENWDDLNMED